MIIIDTSVWIDYFRGRNGRLIAHLQELLDNDLIVLAAPVKIEILSGSSTRDRFLLQRVLQALPLLMPTQATWERMETWTEKAAAKGERFGVTDLLIAGLAADHNFPLWSLDEDFARMRKLGFIQLFAPR
jgi:predicted nucleic acid-binding protein